eukprot:3305010-Rhodomonas_salina.1
MRDLAGAGTRSSRAALRAMLASEEGAPGARRRTATTCCGERAMNSRNSRTHSFFKTGLVRGITKRGGSTMQGKEKKVRRLEPARTSSPSCHYASKQGHSPDPTLTHATSWSTASSPVTTLKRRAIEAVASASTSPIVSEEADAPGTSHSYALYPTRGRALIVLCVAGPSNADPGGSSQLSEKSRNRWVQEGNMMVLSSTETWERV